jgi:transposase
MGDARAFRQGRQLAAWLGLGPRQHFTGGRTPLHGISKRGESYLRTLRIHGARSVLRFAARHTDPTTTWLKRVQRRRNTNIAAERIRRGNTQLHERCCCRWSEAMGAGEKLVLCG